MEKLRLPSPARERGTEPSKRMQFGSAEIKLSKVDASCLGVFPTPVLGERGTSSLYFVR